MSAMKEIKWDFIWVNYLPVSTSDEKSQLLFLSWGWKNVGLHAHLKIISDLSKNEFKENVFGGTFCWENSNILRNLKFQKISAMVVPRPEGKLTKNELSALVS